MEKLDYKILNELSLSQPKTITEIISGMEAETFRRFPLLGYDLFQICVYIDDLRYANLVSRQAIDDEVFGFTLTNKGYAALQKRGETSPAMNMVVANSF